MGIDERPASDSPTTRLGSTWGTVDRPEAAAREADRDLLLGVLALRNGFIDRDSLDAAAAQARGADEGRPLGAILLASGAIDDDQFAILERLVELQLKRHGGNPSKGLASLWATATPTAVPGSTDDREVPTRASAPGEGAGAGRASTRAESPGRLRYRILRHHARGGLGEVYVAEDGELGRKVALKEIQDRHLHAPQNRARFLLEAEVTGNLEHPGIVPVYGLGAYDDGRPFYAMRFIRGQSLKQAIDESRRADAPGDGPGPAGRTSGLRKLLRRFIDVCDAIEYAHSREVLHRDLKPANIMLGKFGETLVVDWGLAKAIGRADPDVEPDPIAEWEGPLRPPSIAEVHPTRMDTAYGTPQYMSPEQADGRFAPVGPATDVYGLGATLYHLLTGRAPFRSGPIEEVKAEIHRGEFPRPREVDAGVPRPLEAICLKAMAIRPEDRYSSAATLAEDVERWLADDPVAVYPDPPSVLMARWARKHRPLVAGTAALLVASVVSLAINNAMVRAEQARTETERARAEQQRERVLATLTITAESLDKLMVGMASDELAQVPQMEGVRQKLTNEAVGVARKILQGWPDDPKVAVLAAPVFHRAANLDRTLGQPDRAFENYRLALGLFDAAVDAGHRKAHGLRSAAAKVGVDFAEGLRMGNRLPEAIRQYDDVLARIGRIRAAAPGDLGHEQTLARAHYNKAGLLAATGRFAPARASVDEALALLDRAIARDPRDQESRLLRTFPLRTKGVIALDSGHPDQAGPAIGRALANLDAVGEPYRGGNNVHFLRAVLHNDRGRWLIEIPSRRPEAEGAHAEALAILERLVVDFPKIPRYRLELAIARLGLAEARAATGGGRRAEATADALEARRALRSLLEEFPKNPETHGEIGRALGLLGRLATDRVEARELLKQAIAEQDLALEENPESPRDRESRAHHLEAFLKL